MKFKGIFIILVLKLLIFSKTTAEVTFEADQHGYVVYCGCMGRKFKMLKKIIDRNDNFIKF